MHTVVAGSGDLNEAVLQGAGGSSHLFGTAACPLVKEFIRQLCVVCSKKVVQRSERADWVTVSLTHSKRRNNRTFKPFFCVELITVGRQQFFVGELRAAI